MFKDLKMIALAATGLRKLALIIGGVLMVMGLLTGTFWLGLLGFILAAGLLGAEWYATKNLSGVQTFAGVQPSTDTVWEQIIMVIGSMLVTFGVMEAEQWAMLSGSVITLITLVRDLIKTKNLA